MSYIRTNGTASGRVCGWGERACADVTVNYTLGDDPAPATVTSSPATPSTLSRGALIAAGAVVLILLTNRPRRR